VLRRLFSLLDAISRDVRYALRGTKRSPGFTAVVVSMLALAIGANTAIFSVVNRLLVRPLPYRAADRLVVFEAVRQYEGAPRPVGASFSLEAARRWLDALRVASDSAYYASAAFQLRTRDGLEIVDGATVSASFFSTLDGPIVAGRPIGQADSLTPSIVISHRLWERLFNASPDAVGSHLVLNSNDYVVIGVAGPAWDVPSSKTDIWQPADFAHLINPACCGVQLFARLRPDVTTTQANADVRDTARALAAVDRRSFGGLHAGVASLRRKQLGDTRSALLMLWAAVGVVFLVACANLLNLLVARNLARTREFAVRQALGASRVQLILQGLTESTVLAIGGVAGGLLVARFAAMMLARVDPNTFPMLHDAPLDPFVLAFTAGLGVMVTLTTGILPSIEAARGSTALRVMTDAAAPRHRRLQRLLCVAQLAAAVVLLVSGTLLARSFVELASTDLGVTPERVMTASIDSAFGRPHSAEEIAASIQRVVERVKQIPGVIAAGAGTSLPPNASRLTMFLKRRSDEVDYVASAVSCTPGYVQALGIRLLKGRLFTEADDPQHPPVMIVSASTARRLFGDADPLGQTMTVPKFRYRITNADQATVVGIVADVKYSGIDAAAGDQVYLSLAQVPWLSTFLTVRTSSDVNVAATLRQIVVSVDPTVSVTSIRPMESIVATAIAPARFRTALVAAFALLALVIAAVGLYGIVSYSVARRTTELGIRMTLGARSRDLMVLVLRDGAGIALAGVMIGVPAAYAASRAFAVLLFGVTPSDRLTYVLSAAALLLTSLAASYLPARRASRVDPIVALHAE
jgi:putative ABC transport system permease protein